MYEHHFGLTKPPFRITPDPEFFFSGGNRGAVLEALRYAMSRGEGIVKVVGEVGSGKTMLCRMLELELPDDCEVVYLANPNIPPAEILHAIAFELGLPAAASEAKLKVQHTLHEHLLAQHADNRRVIMFVEEAQAMPVETLEELRLLSNLETSDDKLLQIVLFGQPELDEKLARHDIRQMRERITHSFELAPFDREQIREYVNARVRGSGYRGNSLFSAGAVRELERYSGGLLRRINVLADKALLAAFAASDNAVSPAHVRLAAKDSAFAPMTGSAAPLSWGVALMLLGVAVGGGMYLNASVENNPQTPITAINEVAAGVAVEPASDPGVAAPAAPIAAVESPESGNIAQSEHAGDPDPAIAAVSKPRFDDNQPSVPVISPQSGLVTLDHPRPRLEFGSTVTP